MLRERPIPRNYRGPVAADAAPPSTGGEDLSSLVAEAQSLQKSLGYARFSHLKAWCDDGQPLTTDADGLELMIERLCIVWVNRGFSNAQ